jgi:hypothetical protein
LGDDAQGLVNPRRRVVRERSGSVRLRLSRRERELLGRLAGELGSRLEDEGDEPDLRRLFPPAYAEHAEWESEYRRLMHDELVAGRREAVQVFAATLDRARLSEEELDAWLGVLNDLRLVLGTRLDVTEETFARPLDPDDVDAPELAVYGYLSWLQEQVVEAAGARPPDR